MADRIGAKQSNSQQRETPMIYSSLAVLALSASAVVNPFTNLVHLHPKPAQPDTRISVTFYNNNSGFRDLKVEGHVYTVMPHEKLFVKAPAGTIVYADSRTLTHKRGDVLMEVTPKLDNQRVNLD